jgi:AraC-like DNA-binding protein
MANIQRVKTVTEFHRTRKLSAPEHPLISVVNYADVKILPEYHDKSWVFDFYFISLKKHICGKITYGQQAYDFDEGVMFFISPGQVFSIEKSPNPSPERSGWMLLIHPDFFWNTPLAKSIRNYEYFDYSINEALFVSKKEEVTMLAIIDNIKQEYHANIDNYSQSIIISQVETLLNYSERFYNRQFLTRKKANHTILNNLEDLLSNYFRSDDLINKGLPTVQYIGENLNISPKYLSNVLKVLTGLTAQQHIHEKLMEKAKEKLSTTELSVGEIAYELGFEHPQSFSKLFKSKTNLSPLEFRRAFHLG